MIYTIGFTESYEQYFKKQKYPHPKKKGRTKRYSGGAVWKTFKEARKHCPKDYSIYGVKASWIKDTILSDKGSWNDLLKDSTLVQLDKNGKKKRLY